MNLEKAAPIENGRKSKNPVLEGKEIGMLRRFAEGKRYHRFNAEVLGDHVLPTTISDLQKAHGIYFSRRRIKVPNRFGTETWVMQYWLENQDLEKARKLLNLGEIAA